MSYRSDFVDSNDIYIQKVTKRHIFKAFFIIIKTIINDKLKTKSDDIKMQMSEIFSRIDTVRNEKKKAKMKNIILVNTFKIIKKVKIFDQDTLSSKHFLKCLLLINYFIKVF